MLHDISAHAHKPFECKFTVKRKVLKADIITENIFIIYNIEKKTYKVSYKLTSLITLYTLNYFNFKTVKITMCDTSVQLTPEMYNHFF